MQDKTLTLRAAFSRDQAQKVYVTNLLQEDSDLVWKIIGEQNGHLYICGYVCDAFFYLFPNSFEFFLRDAKNMANDVRNILLNIVKIKGNMTETEAQQYLKKMDAQKRYSADVWS